MQEYLVMKSVTWTIVHLPTVVSFLGKSQSVFSLVKTSESVTPVERTYF